jgi:hypothetical protein
VAGVTLLYVFAEGLMGGLPSNVSQPYLEQLSLDYYDWTNTNSLTLTLRNVGSAQIRFSDFFIAATRNSTALTFVGGCVSPQGMLPVQASCTLTFPVPVGLTITSGIAYTVKIVAADGTTFTFSCIAGSNTH